MSAGGLLIHEEFVAYFPALGRALGSVEDAVLIQALWFKRDRSTGTTLATYAELADAVGMTERTARRRLGKMVASGVLSKGRAGAYDATTVWTVHLDRIPANSDVANMATSTCRNARVDVANLASSDVANMATSDVAKLATSTYLQEQEELKEEVVGVFADAQTDTTPAPREDVLKVCNLLADLIENNGSKRPTIGQRWLDAARLMIDKDGRTVEEISGAIRWSQNDDFWRSNILSIPKLRDKYDTLRLQASRNTNHGSTGRDRQADILAAEMDAARAADRNNQPTFPQLGYERSPYGGLGQ